MFSSTFYPLFSRQTRITNSSSTQIGDTFANKIDESSQCDILFTDRSDHLPVVLATSGIQTSGATVPITNTDHG